MELLDQINVIIEWSASQLGSLAVDIDSPAVAWVDEAFGVLGNVLPAKRIRRQLIARQCFRGDDIDGRLTNSIKQRELLAPLFGS